MELKESRPARPGNGAPGEKLEKSQSIALMELSQEAPNMPITALTLIFPYRSYSETSAKGIGASLNKLTNFWRDHADRLAEGTYWASMRMAGACLKLIANHGTPVL
jgi:hypothetical protein